MTTKKSGKQSEIRLEAYDAERYREILNEMIPEEYIKSYHRDYKDIFVWDMAHRFAVRLHILSAGFPESVYTAVTNPLREACITVPSRLVMT